MGVGIQRLLRPSRFAQTAGRATVRRWRLHVEANFCAETYVSPILALPRAPRAPAIRRHAVREKEPAAGVLVAAGSHQRSVTHEFTHGINGVN